MTRTPRYRRTPSEHESARKAKDDAGGPVTVPVVDIIVHTDDSMTVTIDGTPYLPEPFAPGWRRESFPAILDTLTARHRTPLRVQVREADGSTFTDIITPPRTRAPEPWAIPPAVTVPQVVAPPPVGAVPAVLHQVVGSRFVPGEDVAVAIIHAHSDAGNDGTARALLTAEHLAAAHTGEVILLGRVSGTVAIGRTQ